jgi:hypothetical protein
MPARFLCEIHRNQLRRQPRQALDLWDQWMAVGQQLMERRDYARAIRYLGSSFDIGEMLLSQPELLQPEEEMSHIDRFMVAGHYLAEAYGRLGEPEQERHYLLVVHQRLMLELGTNTARKPFLKHNIELSLYMLKRHYQHNENFEPFIPCYVEGLTALQANYGVSLH